MDMRSTGSLDMLAVLCFLTCWLTNAIGQKVLTQPGVMSVNLGDTATLDCNIEKDEGKYVFWLKQVPGSPPQHILDFYYTKSASEDYGTGFSSSRFNSKAKNKIDYQLLISNVEASDSAVYYCHTWDDSASSRVSQ
uniref:Ig-like domain-containing protein n=1 Tax=Erpetoichthys calabaricus TaxID=27687 RepID=A0A8C4SIA9_ERPCA